MTRVAIAGLGTVGCGLVSLLEQRGEQVALGELGEPVEIVAISARAKHKPRPFATSRYEWYDDPIAMARDSSADIFVELIGGEDGIALSATRAALEAGKNLVTANKALLAHNGDELSRLAEKNSCSIGWEAAVGGAMPIVAAIRHSLLANRSERLVGILNGTCNYILSRIEAGESFEAALEGAQAQGYAEANPQADIDGWDAAHKIALLSALSFSTPLALAQVSVEGIANITLDKVRAAARSGYCIRLLAICERLQNGLSLRVHPCLLRKDSKLANVSGVSNALVYQGDFCGQVFISGAGAGGEATASAVAGDIFSIARGRKIPLFGLPSASLRALPFCPLQDIISPWHLNFRVKDELGIVAAISAVLRDCGISLASILQDGSAVGDQVKGGNSVSLLLYTHRASTRAIDKALAQIGELGILQSAAFAVRILEEQEEQEEERE